jgi:flagellar protein FliO/FliZ
MSPDSYVRVALALAFVLGLVIVGAALARRSGLSLLSRPGPGRRRRLGIVEVAAIDAKRRLVLVRRDDVEHLILLGSTDIVVETGIRPATETMP